jgi:exodeoxyribonuclease V beta subunit
MKDIPQNIFDIKLSRRLLIEASAGTGKTYTLVALFIRLLIQEKVKPEEILVVTFTRMATKELKERILDRLREVLNALEVDEETDNDFLKDLKQVCKSDPAAIDCIRQTIRDFDEIQVHTIHGFCQKVLKEEALLAGTPVDIELSQDTDHQRIAAESYWRKFIHENSSSEVGHYAIQKLHSIAKSPDLLLDAIKPLLKPVEFQIEPPDKIDIHDYLGRVIEKKRELKRVWDDEQEEINRQLLNNGISRYSGHLESRLNKLTAFLEDEFFISDKPDSLRYFTAEYMRTEDLAKSGNQIRPKHRFFDLCDEYQLMLHQMCHVEPTILRDAAEQIRKKTADQSRTSGIYSYDDLLNSLSEALNDEMRGTKLAAKLQRRYRFALVDEFQDTDPVQYNIFEKIYAGDEVQSSLIMIGDPKQAIYGFRGADIYAYLKAVQDGDQDSVYTLRRNFRSNAGLIDAVNTLFESKENPFLEEKIVFNPSVAGKEGVGLLEVDGEAVKPMQVIHCGDSGTKGDAMENVLNVTSVQIAGLIQQGLENKATIEGRAVTGGDIAVLVSGHSLAEKLKNRLRIYGVDAVTYTREKVFETEEARKLEMVMEAILDPSSSNTLENCLLTGFFGADLKELQHQLKSDQGRESYRQLFTELHEKWDKNGFYSAFRSLMYQHKCIVNLTLFVNSERIITNLQQLAELCAIAERDHHLDAGSLYRWFRDRRANAGDDDEEQLRLESDRNLVKISTIHNSKGLQFPIVFCPDLMIGKSFSSAKGHIKTLHRDDKLILNIETCSTPTREQAKLDSWHESVAEEVRKAYVALTRAMNHCRVLWSSTPNSVNSGLGSLITDTQLFNEITSNKYTFQNGNDHGSYYAVRFRDIASEQADNIGFISLDKLQPFTGRVAADDSEITLKVKSWEGPDVIQVERRLQSFSSLFHHDSSHVAEPDYDQWLETYIDRRDPLAVGVDQKSIFTFPRGAAAGTLIHKLFEHSEFDFTAEQSGEFIPEMLENYGFDPEWSDVLTQMLNDVCGADYTGFDLNRVQSSDLLKEMEFHLPVRNIAVEELLQIIREGGDVDLHAEKAQKAYLTGFIDLVIRQNGKYYILDYKSNHLGDSVEDYSTDVLQKSIRDSGYDVQYHLYIVALIRLLKKAIPEFDYDRDFGGALYLYVRGMREGQSSGIWFDKPDEQVINRLEKAMER